MKPIFTGDVFQEVALAFEAAVQIRISFRIDDRIDETPELFAGFRLLSLVAVYTPGGR